MVLEKIHFPICWYKKAWGSVGITAIKIRQFKVSTHKYRVRLKGFGQVGWILILLLLTTCQIGGASVAKEDLFFLCLPSHSSYYHVTWQRGVKGSAKGLTWSRRLFHTFWPLPLFCNQHATTHLWQTPPIKFFEIISWNCRFVFVYSLGWLAKISCAVQCRFHLAIPLLALITPATKSPPWIAVLLEREDWRGRERLCVFSSSSHLRLSVHFPQWGISLPSTAIANSVRISLWYK